MAAGNAWHRASSVERSINQRAMTHQKMRSSPVFSLAQIPAPSCCSFLRPGSGQCIPPQIAKCKCRVSEFPTFGGLGNRVTWYPFMDLRVQFMDNLAHSRYKYKTSLCTVYKWTGSVPMVRAGAVGARRRLGDPIGGIPSSENSFYFLLFTTDQERSDQMVWWRELKLFSLNKNSFGLGQNCLQLEDGSGQSKTVSRN